MFVLGALILLWMVMLAILNQLSVNLAKGFELATAAFFLFILLGVVRDLIRDYHND